MQDNLLLATESMRSSVTGLKKKSTNLKIQLELLDSELEKISGKFDKVVNQAEIFKAKVLRESNREIRRLQQEVDKLKKQLPSSESGPQLASSQELQIASTIAIFESLLRFICEGADDFRLMSYSFLFPAVFERVVSGDEEAYLLDSLPDSAHIVIQQGKEYVQWVRKDCDVHLTDPEAWNIYSEEICKWWRNTALPLIYGCRDEHWDADEPLSLIEMLSWRDDPADRPLMMPYAFDAYEIYKKNKDAVFERTGLREFELKMFSFSAG
jgi:hypothetical protein